ncbi:MAG: long-chain fatty acid--CoA ligase [Pseudomonadota bacterium]|jgi:acyl-CoA synthetase (AMP-forming)/AMP-acid ligase II
MAFNLGEMLAHRAYLSPDKEGFVDATGRRRTYRESDARAARFASFLARKGMGAGERVAILCRNDEHVATAFFAAAKIGAVAVILNWRLQPAELAYILSDCGARALLYDAAFAATVDGLRGRIGVEIFMCKGGKSSDHDYDEIVETERRAPPPTEAGGSDPALIMYTSGTTGRPKGAVLTHDNLLWATLAISCTIEWNHDHRFLLVAPLFHIGGLAPLVTNVHKGCTTVFMLEFEPAAVWRVIQYERINTMMSVPLMLRAMLMAAQKTKVDASSLISITCGASAVPKELISAYADMGIRVQQVSGITECAGAVSFWTPAMNPQKMHSQGRVAFHCRVRIVNPEAGTEVPHGLIGEIWCRGPMVFAGYWNNPEATRAALRDGWYRSGDLGYMDEEGYLFVVDRLKDMIISGGENIYPAELEAVIAGHEAVAEVAVVGRADATWGEVPVAYVVRKPGARLDAEDVIALCRERLASYKCVKAVEFVEALPKNSVGKILKRELRG